MSQGFRSNDYLTSQPTGPEVAAFLRDEFVMAAVENVAREDRLQVVTALRRRLDELADAHRELGSSDEEAMREAIAMLTPSPQLRSPLIRRSFVLSVVVASTTATFCALGSLASVGMNLSYNASSDLWVPIGFGYGCVVSCLARLRSWNTNQSILAGAMFGPSLALIALIVNRSSLDQPGILTGILIPMLVIFGIAGGMGAATGQFVEWALNFATRASSRSSKARTETPPYRQ